MAHTLIAMFLAATLGGDPPQADAAKKGREQLALTAATLLEADTAEWEATLDVLEAPKLQDRKYAFPVGPMRYRFRVKGDSRLYWAETWQGKGAAPTREAWYEGNILYVRPSSNPKKLIPIEVGESEGFCVKHSLVDGGILGWRLAHAFDNEEAAGGFVAAMDVQWVGEEKIKDAAAVVLDVKIGFGFAGHHPRRESGTTRLWIDKKSSLPIKRETTLDLGDEDKSVKLHVKETYANWQLNQPLANDTFHVQGMGPPYALVDAPKDPEEFEVAQTKKFLGFAVRDFPEPQGPTRFQELPADAPKFDFKIAARKVSGPYPREWYSRERVSAETPDGGKINAVLDSDRSSTSLNRRHIDGGRSPRDVLIYVQGKATPSLVFRDVGSHANAPHSVAVDEKGRCHLMLADVDTGQYNRFKLYWLIGDLKTGKWSDAWLVDRRPTFTSSAIPWSAAWKEQVHLVWRWSDDTFGDKRKENGIFHVQWSPAGFGPKTRLYRGSARNFDMAMGSATGRLVLIFSDENGVFVASKADQGPWSRPTRLHPDLTENHTVSIQPAAENGFVIRTHAKETKEWLLTVDGGKP